ncbi:hypothetical protein TELCIR_04168 [Teladorsagia circumcincta]|uniref:PiggyBac transposable element-derived protein domain-containing protein n=1 Tax=Teladorsagia circumcincta TaxID=45464 RepID=A0A2G9UUB2_TELCI|nr:hypothetical protein TELCIR_04168 [Teladorsagia circumcincta]
MMTTEEEGEALKLSCLYLREAADWPPKMKALDNTILPHRKEIESMDGLNEDFDQLLIESDDEQVTEGLDAPENMLAAVLDSSDGESDSDESDSHDDGSQWTPNVQKADEFLFNGVAGILDNEIYLFRDPIQFYQLFMTQDLVDLIVEESNRYGSRKFRDWVDLDEEEFFTFLALCFHMGLERRSNLKDYWSKRKKHIKVSAATNTQHHQTPIRMYKVTGTNEDSEVLQPQINGEKN